jgi:DTW domain-containing protein YfiP
VLIHPKESRNAVGTARIVTLGVRGARLIRGRGAELDRDPWLRACVADPGRRVFVLYPGRDALDLDGEDPARVRAALGPADRLTLLLIDGTWPQARRMIRESRVLAGLPQLRFAPRVASRYVIREQPHPVCVSTVEAAHELLGRLMRLGVASLPDGAADGLLEVFDWLVQVQVESERQGGLVVTPYCASTS